MNINNLKLLRDGLPLVAKPDLFSMWRFRSDGTGELANIHTCNTTACVLGWAPTISGLEALPEDGAIGVGVYIDWLEYCWRVFGLDHKEWNWCFAQDWAIVDDTIEGAIERIDYLIRTGKPGKLYVMPEEG